MSAFRLNRFCSKPLTKLLLKTPLTPNQITLISLGFGVLAGVLFSKGTYGFSVAAGASYQLALVLDNCDGEVARAKNMGSVFGGWLDVGADLLTDISFFLGIYFGTVRQEVQGPAMLFMMLCLSGAFLHFLLVVLEKLKGFGPAVFSAPHPEHERRNSIFLDIFDALREGDVSWLVLLCTLIGQTPVLLWVGGVYMQLLWLSAVLINFRWVFQSKTAGPVK